MKIDRVAYIQARLKQLKEGHILPAGFSNWLVRLELGEQPAGQARIQPVYAAGSAGRLVAALIRELKELR